MDSSLAHLISWSEHTKGDVPAALTGPSITISPLSAPHPPTVFLFGGKYVHSRRLTNEMWAMDLATRVWERVDAGEDGPGPRYFHSMDTWQDKLVCFGGMSDTDPLSVHDDIWFFDCATRKWLPQEHGSPHQDAAYLPSPRYAHLSAVSRGKLVISGGQHADNSWVYEINVYDLKRRMWVSKTTQPELQGQHSKGAYRSVAASSKQRVINPSVRADGKSGASGSLHSYAIDEEGEGGEIVCYSNYDFAKVRRELDIISPDDRTDLSVRAEPSASSGSSKHVSPPDFTIRDDSHRMIGAAQPPGLRFPNGGIVGNHFVLCGLYLASTSAVFSIWVMDLRTYTWRQIEPAALSVGSWNRAVVWPERAKLIVFGNAQLDLAADYARRAVNLDHMAVVSLETFGVYRPPKLVIPAQVQEIGLTALDEKLASDFEVVCEDGRRVRCARAVLRERWAWFAEQERDVADRVGETVRDAPAALDINDTLLGGFTPARLAPSHLTIPEPFSVCVALVQYFYTLSLSTPLQNRAPVLSALLFLAKQYKIDRLARLVVHALHDRLEPSVAVGIYEIATLSGEQGLQIRALQMIHAAKTAAAARYGRGGPGSAQSVAPTSAATSGPPPTASTQYTSTGDMSGTSSAFSGSTGGGGSGAGQQQRSARCGSVVLGDDAVQEIDTLLDALKVDDSEVDAFHEEVARPESPLEPSYPPLQERRASRPASLAGAPPTRQLPTIPSAYSAEPESWSPALSSASSESTAPYPNTPALTIDDYAPSVAGALSVAGRSDRSASEKDAWTSPPKKREGMQFVSTRAEPVGLGIAVCPSDTPAPLSARSGGFLSHSSSISSLFSQSSGGSRGRGATTGKDSHLKGELRHHASTMSSQASSDSLHQDWAYRRGTASRDMLPALPEHTSAPFEFGTYRTRWGSGTMTTLSLSPSTSDSMSISSDSTGTSSQRAVKAEKKALAAAEKAQRKAEAREKFEALRAEQRRKMGISQAEAQRKAETARLAPELLENEKKVKAKDKDQPKGRLGRFGAKFVGAVLFPEGGKNSTMF